MAGTSGAIVSIPGSHFGALICEMNLFFSSRTDPIADPEIYRLEEEINGYQNLKLASITGRIVAFFNIKFGLCFFDRLKDRL